MRRDEVEDHLSPMEIQYVATPFPVCHGYSHTQCILYAQRLYDLQLYEAGPRG